MTRTLHHRVAQSIVSRQLWSPHDRVAVAVSGGADSVTLLDLLVASRGIHGGDLRVVTVDHGTRAESADDADFVAALADHYGLACERVTLSLGARASEAACREARYAVLASLDVEAVALAHHRDDQVETSLLGLMRGGGSCALGGMAWRRGRYVRPLLDVSRATLRTWATQNNLKWCEDPSNHDPRFLRNRVRHELIPLLEDLRPGCTAAIARGAAHAADDDHFLDRTVHEADPFADGAWPRSWLASAPAPLARRALLRRLDGVASAHIDAILRVVHKGHGEVQLTMSRGVLVDRDLVRIVDAS